MKQRRIDIIYKPLTLTAILEPESSVPARQTFNSYAYDEETSSFIEQYTPDYTVTPLILMPQVSIYDKDGILPNGNVNSSLTNIAWYEIIDGVRTQILDTNTDYEIMASGEYKGRLTIKRNFSPSYPATFEFQCSYLDSRTNQTLTKIMTYLVICEDETDAQPDVVLSCGESTTWNPLTDADEIEVTADLRLQGVSIAAANRVFVWEELRSAGGYTQVGTDNADGDVSVSSDTVTMTLNRRLMGDGITLRCRAKYDPTGTDPSSVVLTELSPVAYMTIRRRMPYFEPDYVGVPSNISPKVEYLYPQAVVKTGVEQLSDWEGELEAIWYIATNNASASLTYSQVAEGANPEVPTTKLNSTYGASLAIDVKDRGALGAWTDADGSTLVDADGAVIMFH